MSVFLSLNDASTVKRIEEGRINRRMKSRQSSVSSSKTFPKLRAHPSLRAHAMSEAINKERASSDTTPYWLSQSSNVLSSQRVRTLDTFDAVKVNFTTTKEFDIRRHRLPSESKLELTITQKRTREWHAKMKNMLDHFAFHHLNTWITLMPFKSRQGNLLFSPVNISMLRYSWFEGVRTDWERVHQLVHYTHPDGMPVLASMRRITGLTSDVVLTVEELAAAGLPIERTGLISGLPPLLEPKEPEDFSLREAVGDPSTSIRAIFALPKYWSDVYHDLRFDALQSNPLGNYFDMIPSVELIKTQLLELLDYFFTHLCTLQCKLHNVTSSTDLQALSLYFFVYFPDFGHEWFRMMSLVRDRAFKHQKKHDKMSRVRDSAGGSTSRSQTSSTISTNLLATYSLDSILTRDSSMEEPKLVREFLLMKLHGAMTTNVRSIVMPENHRKSHVRSDRYHAEEEVCDLWSAMIKFMVVDFFERYCNTGKDEVENSAPAALHPLANSSATITFLRLPVYEDGAHGEVSPRSLNVPISLLTGDLGLSRVERKSQDKHGLRDDVYTFNELCGTGKFPRDLAGQENVTSRVC